MITLGGYNHLHDQINLQGLSKLTGFNALNSYSLQKSRGKA